MSCCSCPTKSRGWLGLKVNPGCPVHGGDPEDIKAILTAAECPLPHEDKLDDLDRT